MFVVKLSHSKITRRYKTIKVYNGVFLHLKGEYYLPYFLNPSLMSKLLSVYGKQLVPKMLEDEQKYQTQYKHTIKEVVPIYDKTYDYYIDKELELLSNTIAGVLDFPELQTINKVFLTARESLNITHLTNFFMNKKFKMYYVMNDDKALILPQLNLTLPAIESGKITVFRENTLKRYMKNHMNKTTIPFGVAFLPFSHPFYAVYLAGSTVNKAKLFKIITLSKQNKLLANITISENLKESPPFKEGLITYYLPAIDYTLNVVKHKRADDLVEIYITKNYTPNNNVDKHLREFTRVSENCFRYTRGHVLNNIEHKLCNPTITKRRAFEVLKRIKELTLDK